MDLKRVSVEEAKKLLDDEDYVLLDVRSMPEFSEEHSDGAFNVPFLHKTPQGMIPNQDFVRVVQFTFPDPATKIVTTCQMGGRSSRAAAELMNLGYSNVVDLKGGFGGERDDAGQLINPGWKDAGFAVESGEPEGRSYRWLNNKANQTRKEAEGESAAPEAAGKNEILTGQEIAEDAEGMNRFASRKRMVKCIRMGKELPGLKRRPYPGPLGERIFKEVSAVAWNDWVEHSKMIINEYRINSADPGAMKLLIEQCESYFYGEGASRPEGFVPQA